jgi:hypothetical protein
MPQWRAATALVQGGPRVRALVYAGGVVEVGTVEKPPKRGPSASSSRFRTALARVFGSGGQATAVNRARRTRHKGVACIAGSGPQGQRLEPPFWDFRFIDGAVSESGARSNRALRSDHPDGGVWRERSLKHGTDPYAHPRPRGERAGSRLRASSQLTAHATRGLRGSGAKSPTT